MKRTMCVIASMVCACLLLCQSAWADAAFGGEHGFADADYYVVVDAPDGYVNFRYGPGLEYGVYCPIYNGEILHIIQTAENYFDQLSWGEAEYDGYYGWISLSQVSFAEYSQAEPAYSEDPYNENYLEDPYDPEEVYYENSNNHDPSLHLKRQIWPDPEETNEDIVVTDAYRYEKSLLSDTGMETGKYVFAIPQINLSGDEAAYVNEAVYEDLSWGIMDSLQLLEAGDFPGVEDLLESSYDWYINGDILSVVFYLAYGGPWHEYAAMNFSIANGTMLDTQEVYEAAGFTKEEYLAFVTAACNMAYGKVNETTANAPSLTAQEQSRYNELALENVSEENLAAVQPYLNKEGHLCIAADIYLFMMQNSESWSLIDVESGELLAWEPGARGGNTNPSNENAANIPAVPSNDSAGTPTVNTGNSDYYMIVNAPDNYLNLRTGAGVSYDIITPIYNGEILRITDLAYNGMDGLYWGRTSYQEMDGWVSISQARAIYPGE